MGHADGSPGPSGQGGFAAEAGRYHLYVSLACPWAHRTIIFRKLKALENVVSMSIVSPDCWASDGWTFNVNEGSTGDALNSKSKLSEIYLLADPRYSGRVSVPVLWDKKRNTIVNNESPEIIRMLNSAFDALTQCAYRLLSGSCCAREIDRFNALIYPNINNGVYRAGFATSQAAYEEAFRNVFDTLDELEQRPVAAALSCRKHDHRGRLAAVLDADPLRCRLLLALQMQSGGASIEYPNLSNYLRDLYQVPGVAETVSIEQIKRHYYGSQRQVNPTGIVPVGPQLDFAAPHDRARFARRSPQLAYRCAAEHFGHAGAGGAAVASSGSASFGGRIRAQRFHDWGFGFSVLPKIADDEQRDVVAP